VSVCVGSGLFNTQQPMNEYKLFMFNPLDLGPVICRKRRNPPTPNRLDPLAKC